MNVFKLFILFVFLSVKANAQSISDSMTAYKIVNLSIAAMGGMEYLKTVKTLYTDVKTEMEGRQVHWIIKEMAPNKGSFQIEYKNIPVYQNWFDGKKGYEIVNGKKKKAHKDDFKDKHYKKHIFNEIDYLDSTLWKLEYLGIGMSNNDSCYKIKAALASGLVVLLYFDKNSFHMVRSDKIEAPEKDRFTTYLYSNFKKFGKLVYHTEFKYGEDGNYQSGKIVELLVNESVYETDFE